MQPLDFILNFGGAITAFSEQYSEWILPLFFVLIFCETGLVFTPFLPGSTLLLIAGGLAAAGDFALYEILGVLIAAALLGDAMGFFFGRLLGAGSSLIKPAYLAKANAFRARFGSMAYAIARFVPVARGLVPFIAGANGIAYRAFLPSNAIGVAASVTVFCGAGYFSTQLRQVPPAAWVALGAVIAAAAAVFLVRRHRHRRREQAIRSEETAPSASSQRPDHDSLDL